MRNICGCMGTRFAPKWPWMTGRRTPASRTSHFNGFHWFEGLLISRGILQQEPSGIQSLGPRGPNWGIFRAVASGTSLLAFSPQLLYPKISLERNQRPVWSKMEYYAMPSRTPHARPCPPRTRASAGTRPPSGSAWFSPQRPCSSESPAAASGPRGPGRAGQSATAA